MYVILFKSCYDRYVMKVMLYYVCYVVLGCGVMYVMLCMLYYVSHVMKVM